MNAADVVAYTYAADMYHAWCVVEEIQERYDALPDPVLKTIREESNEVALDAIATFLGFDRVDEWSYDSGDFPKSVSADQIRWDEDEDGCGPDACGRCGESFDT